jgi:hypothetical protein
MSLLFYALNIAAVFIYTRPCAATFKIPPQYLIDQAPTCDLPADSLSSYDGTLLIEDNEVFCEDGARLICWDVVRQKIEHIRSDSQASALIFQLLGVIPF